MQRPHNSKQTGFTVVELMIATVVFSSVLLLVTFGLIQVTRIYYKGITTSRTQQTARAIMDEISQAIQFSGEAVALPVSVENLGGSGVTHSYFCTGSSRYTFIQGKKLVDSSTPSEANNETSHALVRDERLTGSCSEPTDSLYDNLNLNGYEGSFPTELLAPNMRLSNLEITNPSPDLYRIDLRIAYGDSDLLNDPTGTDATCKSSTGGQFCAVSHLVTTVQRRVD